MDQELRLLITLGVPLGTTLGCSRPEVQEVYTRAHILYEELADGSHYFLVLAGLWAYYLVRADLKTARGLAEQLLLRAEGRDLTSELEAHRALGHTLTYLGEIDSAQKHFQRVLDGACHLSNHHASYLFFNGLDSEVTSRSYMGLDLWLLGFPEQALQCVEMAVARGGEVSHPLSLALALDFACGIHQLRGDVQRAAERAKDLTILAGEHGLSLFSAYAAIWQGWALVCRGQYSEGIQHMRSGIDGCRVARTELSVPHFLGLLAEAYLRSGQEESGLQAVDDALEVSEATGNHYYDAELTRLKGELLRSGHRHTIDEVDSCFATAIEISRRQGARSLELRATISKTRYILSHNRSLTAVEELSSLLEWFTEGYDTSDLQEARLLARSNPRLEQTSVAHGT
jgi:predicted ATPase